MFVIDKLRFPVTIELPEDWKEQVAGLALVNDLKAKEVTKLPSNEVMFSLEGAMSNGEHFTQAVNDTCDQVAALLSPPSEPTYEERLKAAALRAKEGGFTSVTGRELLSWFGAARRGARVVERIRAELDRHSMLTEPDFNEVWDEVPLKLKAAPTAGQPNSGAAPPQVPPPPPTDPVHRIGRLPVANLGVESVPLGTTVTVALTTMMLRDYSQLPVMRNERDCRGAVSWQSIGEARALGRACETVDQCLVPIEEVTPETPLLDAIPRIISRGFVLVRGPDRRYQGIVTVTDLSLQFRALSEPFLLLGQIENHIRGIVQRTFSLEEMRDGRNPGDTTRVINDVSDLTFGEYVRILEPADRWPRLRVTFARDPFLADLREIVSIRNEVMHFDPDPLEDSQLALLRNFSAFLEQATAS